MGCVPGRCYPRAHQAGAGRLGCFEILNQFVFLKQSSNHFCRTAHQLRLIITRRLNFGQRGGGITYNRLKCVFAHNCDDILRCINFLVFFTKHLLLIHSAIPLLRNFLHHRNTKLVRLGHAVDWPSARWAASEITCESAHNLCAEPHLLAGNTRQVCGSQAGSWEQDLPGNC